MVKTTYPKPTHTFYWKMLNVQLVKPQEYTLDILFPENWNELMLEELQIIADSYFESELSIEELFVRILGERIKAKYPKVETDRVLALLNIEDMALEYIDMMAFLTEANLLTKNPLAIPGTTMPEDSFNSTLVGEFEIADQALSLWREDPVRNAASLDEFFQALFRTKIEVPASLKRVAALFFIGCKNELMQLFPGVFGGGGEANERPDPMALTRVIHESAGPANGTRKDIRQTLLKEFMYELQLQTERE